MNTILSAIKFTIIFITVIEVVGYSITLSPDGGNNTILLRALFICSIVSLILLFAILFLRLIKKYNSYFALYYIFLAAVGSLGVPFFLISYFFLGHSN